MKRTLIATTCLLALSLAVLLSAHLRVNSAGRRVEVQETVFSGSPASAAGLELTLRIQDQQGHLFWSTAFSPGMTQEAKTNFRFCAKEPEMDMAWAAEPYVQLSADILAGIGGYFDPADPADDFLFSMAADVVERATPGETRTEVLLVEDYIQTYPLALSINYDGGIGDTLTSKSWEALASYFQYQVAPGQQVEVAVTTDTSGMITDVNASYSGGQPYIQSQGVVTERGAYFLAQAWDGGGPTDLLHCAQGQGIHFIPLEQEGPACFDPDGLRLFYPLDPASALFLGLTEDCGRLLLYTREENRLILTVIDALTGARLQRLDLIPIGPDESLNGTIDEGPLHLAALAGESGGFCLLEEGPGGLLCALTGVLDRNDYNQSALASPNWDAALAWDGRRLFWAVPGTDREYNRLPLRLGVWDEEGLQFLARYDASPGWDPAARENPYLYPYGKTEPVSLVLLEKSLNFCEK